MIRIITIVAVATYLAGCAGHRLESYDVGLTAGQTEFTGETDTKTAATVNGRVNFHFGVKPGLGSRDSGTAKAFTNPESRITSPE